MRIHKLGRFGGNVKNYELGRSGYPKEVFTYLKNLLNVKRPLILDLGCGTGISTRQLAKIGTVVGVDPDPVMLKAARRHKTLDIKQYVQARADKLPFGDDTFDVVTAFSALHWFSDKKSISEIKRVLKPNGLLFVTGKPAIKSWGQGYRNAIIKSINRGVAEFITAKRWEPRKILKNSGFKNVRSKQWRKSEIYSLPKALDYVQSVSIWNSVPKSLRQKALGGLKVYFKNVKKRFGKIEKRYKVPVAVGMK